jgi:alginate O-acetyltransferase complex protein AlgI
MVFNSSVFLFAFLPIVFTAFWTARTKRQRHVILTVSGYVFYGYWDWRFCGLMAFSTLVSYSAGLGFLRYSSPRMHKLLLTVPITVDLLLLGFFKYAGFALATANGAVQWFGYELGLPALSIILPVGISFYTFHTITYIVDSYRGAIKPTRNLPEFAAYVSLFSQLVAGPIVRFRQIEEDLEGLGSADRTRWLGVGISFFVYGLAEKVLVADTLAAFVDPTLARYGQLSTLGVWLAMLGYAFQLYFDFCGYSDMAVGLGYMFGIRIPLNFNSPYKALDPSDFWRRWHISLSTCLRDYLYIPLGGNRHGERMMYRNLMLTMLIGGLWHGANWTFVVWGAYHGLLLVAYRLRAMAWDRLSPVLRQMLMFLLVLVGWVFFRSTDFAMALHLLEAMFTPMAGSAGASPGVFAVATLIAGWWAMRGPNAQEVLADFQWKPRYGLYEAAALGACVAVMAAGRNSPFLYFQF